MVFFKDVGVLHNIQYTSYVTLWQPINLLSASTRQGPGQSARHTPNTHAHTTHSYLVTHIKLHHLLFVSRGIPSPLCFVTAVIVAIALVLCALAALARCAMSRGANFRAFYRLTLSNLINLSQLTKIIRIYANQKENYFTDSVMHEAARSHAHAPNIKFVFARTLCPGIHGHRCHWTRSLHDLYKVQKSYKIKN